MTHRENYLRAVRFEKPDYVPMGFWVNPACWHHYPQNWLQEVMAAHPLLFPGYKKKALPVQPKYGLNCRAGVPYRDPWGCVWATTDDGITGTVIEHPLADWRALEEYAPPNAGTTDGVGPLDWGQIEVQFGKARDEGQVKWGGLSHGHTFLRLCDLRGYENLLLDMSEGEPRLGRLIDLVEMFNRGQIQRYVQLGAEVISYPEDLGMQVGPMISPALFRQYIKPVYQRLMAPAREAGAIVHMHSDGDIRSLADDLVEGGVAVLNLQDLVNGVEWIRDRFYGRVCIDLDIDRQNVTARGRADEIDRLIREEVQQLGSRQGGLTMIYGLYPGVPQENVAALMDAMERYATYWS